jgi:cyclopropane fatty-acyl-phospholipid synthase-like methyltransferase
MKLHEYYKYNENNSPEVWNTDLDCYPLSGLSIIPDIVKLNPNRILDVGCGYNEFKKYFENLEGIDLTNSSADWVGDMLEYPADDNTYDVILALGSVNFIDKETVYKQMSWIADKLKAGGTIFMRVNPSHAPSLAIADQFYLWTIEDIHKVGEENKLQIADNAVLFENRIESDRIRSGNDSDNFSNLRLYWRYIKDEV